MYSSTLSASDPYANIRIVAMHFCNGERPILLDASDLILEIRTMITENLYNSKEQWLLHLKPSSKLPLCVYRILKEVVIQQVTMSTFTIVIYMVSFFVSID